MNWTKVQIPVPGIEVCQIVGEDGRMLGGEDAAFTRGEAEWLLRLIGDSEPAEAGE